MKINAGQFKAKCLKLMDEVSIRRGEIVITKRGKPVARLVPCEGKTPPLYGRMKGTITFLGDIVAPTGEKWHAES
jgi:prevent-host-death family protein